MKTVVILVGTELLSGGMIDSNSLYMAEELNKYGIEIEFKFSVRDDIGEIKKAITFAKTNADLVILSGGLGPTIDDITKEAIAEYLGKKLIVEEEELNELKRKFEKLNIEFLDMNFKEVEKPEGSISFKNDVGMAPAIYVDGIAAFPGVPIELHNMFPKFLKYYAKEKELSNSIYIKDILTFGIPESILENKVKDLFQESNIYYEFLVKKYATVIRMQTNADKKNKVEKIVEKIYNRIERNIFGEDNDRLETKLVEYLIDNKLDISVAESCTGGLLSAKIVDVPGASKVFKEGLVTYSNEAKMERLGVKKESLEKYGAVSEEVAREMLENLKTDTAISVTGIAGPGGGSDEKPVGLVYIGTKYKNEIKIHKKIFGGTRDRIRERTVTQALFNMLENF